MNRFECMNDIEKFIESIPMNEIKEEIIGNFGDDPIEISGKRICKTMLGNFFAVRWINTNKKSGIFSKGLAFYNYDQSNDFPLLKIVR